LGYELTTDSLAITIHDESGWLASVSGTAGNPVSSLVADGLFDLVVADPRLHCVRLVKRLDRGSAGERQAARADP
jgi:hypothetical protein